MSLQEDLSKLKDELIRVVNLVETRISIPPKDQDPEEVHLAEETWVDGLGVQRALRLQCGGLRVAELATAFADGQDIVKITKLARAVFAFYRKAEIASKNMEDEVRGATEELERIQ